MTPQSWLTQARVERGWTQAEAVAAMGLSQAYLSLIEGGRRPISRRLAATIGQYFELPATALEPRDGGVADPRLLAGQFADLGYEPFGERGTDARIHPAELLLSTLRQDDLQLGLIEALPWLAFTYFEMDWDWVVPKTKVDDLQNRLGFIVTLARELAEKRGDESTTHALAAQERRLGRSLLVLEDTLCQDSMSDAERSWLRNHRPPEAARWHLLTSLKTSDLPYAP